MNRDKATVGEIYHIFNRGVEKRLIFNNDADRKRFLDCLYAFNDSSPAFNFGRDLIEVGLQSDREKLVEIMAFALMPNHYHLMLRGLTENGITDFMRKLGTGYTNYFNTKYDRVGPLFQGKYKAVLIKDQRQFMYLPYYIHLNPLDLIDKKWRDGRMVNVKKAQQFLETYKWSSYKDYIGKKNFSDVIDKKFLSEFFENPEHYKTDMFEWLKDGNLKEISDIALESTGEA